MIYQLFDWSSQLGDVIGGAKPAHELSTVPSLILEHLISVRVNAGPGFRQLLCFVLTGYQKSSAAGYVSGITL